MDRQGTFRQVIKWAVVCAVVAGTSLLAPAPIYAGICTITVNPATLPGGTVGVPYSQSITGTGCLGPSYTFSVTSGTLPTGLTLTPPGFTNSATLSGTPTAPGSFTFTISAADDANGRGSQTYTVIISCPSIGILPSTLPGVTQGAPYSQTLTGVGGQSPYTFLLIAGNLPTGLTLSNSGLISGTPTVPGAFPFTVQATDVRGCKGSASYTIVVSPSCMAPESPFLSATPSTVNTSQPITLAWNATIAADQGSYTVLFSLNGGGFLAVGTVPSSSASTLSFTYVATTAGTYAFEVQAVASCGASSFSNTPRVVVLGPCPQAPRVGGVVVTPTTAAPGASFTLSWSPLGNFSGSYLVYRSTDGGKSFQLLATTSNTSFTGTVTDPVGTVVTFEVEGLVNCIFATQSNFVTLTVVGSGNCTPPGAVSNVQVQSAGVAPPRAPAPTEFIAVSWTAPAGGTPPTRYSVRLNGDPEVFVQTTSVTLLPRGSRLDPIQAFVKALACSPEQAGPEASSAVVALFLTSPKASFTVSSNPRVNVAVVFTDTSSPQATSWLWVFDDGTTDQRQSPSHVFAIPGPHVVNFIASNGAGSSQTAQVVTIGAAGGVIEAARVVGIDATDPERRRAQVLIANGPTWLRIRALSEQEVVVFLRFLDEGGEPVMERRLVVGGGEEGLYDLSAYGLRGEYGIELVGGGEYEPTLTVVGRPGVREMER